MPDQYFTGIDMARNGDETAVVTVRKPEHGGPMTLDIHDTATIRYRCGHTPIHVFHDDILLMRALQTARLAALEVDCPHCQLQQIAEATHA